MPINSKVNTLMDIVLRVPPVFFMDAVLNYDFSSLRFDPQRLFGLERYELNQTNMNESSAFSPEQMKYQSFTPWLVQGFVVLGISIPVFSFTTKQLVLIYIKIISLVMIISAYILNAGYIDFNINGTSDGQISQLTGSLYHLILLILTTVFSLTLTGNMIPQLATWILFFMPRLSFLLPLSPAVIKLTPLLSVSGCIMLLAYSMWMHGFNVCETVYNGLMWCHSIVESYDIFSIFEIHWVNLHIPQVFRTYWAVKNAYDIMIAMNESTATLTAYDITKISIISSTENLVSLIGLISVISLSVHTFSYMVHVFLELKEPFDKEIGQMLGSLLFIFCLQGNVTHIDAEMRYQQVSHHFLLLLLALLHFLYYEIKDELLSIGTSNNPSTERHIKTLIIASLPIILSSMILQYEFSIENSTSWLICSSALNAEIMLKSVVTIAIYTLLMIDAYKYGLWENLDDYIFNLKFGLNIIEFLLGICLVLTHTYIFFFESTSLIRIMLINVHLYFNVWVPFSRGKDVYYQHHTALNKVRDLPIATKEQLRQKKDVCAICYQPLNSARITNCNHFFHGVCLRKWLNVQSTCPLCFNGIDTPSAAQLFWQSINEAIMA
ncbi:Protein TRC8 [Araneus ventricosus]|uniref:Protein TRC8 n=1 Tax=Araneus ventricosus TaxID=182803 RepID=A0A4Y2AGH1_ARAVE|nr:Protein TRC8 [Araneus ventricosus]